MPLWQRLEIQALLLALSRLTIIRSSHSYPWQLDNLLIPAMDLFYVEKAGFLIRFGQVCSPGEYIAVQLCCISSKV
jgi:hypothetical protein